MRMNYFRIVLWTVMLAHTGSADIIATITLQDGLAPWAGAPGGAYAGTEDTRIVQEDADTNFGTESSLRVRDRFIDDDALVRFNMAGIVPLVHSSTITGATLSFRNSANADSLNADDLYNRLDLFLVDSDDSNWTETGATWNRELALTDWDGGSGEGSGTDRTVLKTHNNEMQILASATVSGTSAHAGEWVTFNLDFGTLPANHTSVMQNWLSGGWNGGFVVVAHGRDIAGQDGPFVYWHTSEAADAASRPILTLTGTFDVVPEPGALGLFALGLLGLQVMRLLPPNCARRKANFAHAARWVHMPLIVTPLAQRGKKGGFTLVELLVIIAIIGLLILLLSSVIGGAIDKARAAGCMSNVRQCGMATLMFAHDHNDYLPPLYHNPSWIHGGGTNRWWMSDRWLGPYLGMGMPSRRGAHAGAHRCPSTPHFGIGYNHSELSRLLSGNAAEFSIRIRDVRNPNRTVAFADAGLISNPVPAANQDPDSWTSNRNDPTSVMRTPSNAPWYNTLPERAVNRHAGYLNAGFLDGSVQRTKASGLGFQYPRGHEKALWDRL
jgi:prepilin-type processing-associated H-X9-DG protein